MEEECVCVYVCVLTSSYSKKVAEGEKIQCDLLCLSVQKEKKKKTSGSGYWLCEEENNVLFFLSILFLWNSSRKTARPCALLLKKK